MSCFSGQQQVLHLLCPVLVQLLPGHQPPAMSRPGQSRRIRSTISDRRSAIATASLRRTSCPDNAERLRDSTAGQPDHRSSLASRRECLTRS